MSTGDVSLRRTEFHFRATFSLQRHARGRQWSTGTTGNWRSWEGALSQQMGRWPTETLARPSPLERLFSVPRRAMLALGKTRTRQTLCEPSKRHLARNVLREDESQTSGDALFCGQRTVGLCSRESLSRCFARYVAHGCPGATRGPWRHSRIFEMLGSIGKACFATSDLHRGPTGTALGDARHGDVSAVGLVCMVTSTPSGCTIRCCLAWSTICSCCDHIRTQCLHQWARVGVV